MPTIMSIKPGGSVLVQRQIAYESLRRALQLGRVPRGQRLKEAEWSQQLGVNRSAIREALARLLSDGLVVEGAKRGCFVPTPTSDELREVGELRLLLELRAVDQILRAEHNSSAALADLHGICDDQDWMIQRGYTADLADADLQFHEKLVALSGGSRLLSLYKTLPQIPLPLACTDRIRGPGIWRDLVVQHRAIISALAKGRSDQVKSLLEEHYHSGCALPK